MNEDLSVFSTPNIKSIVQDMRDLLSQGQLSFLLGAGCSRIAGLPLMPGLTEQVLDHTSIGESTKTLLEKVKSLFSGSSLATIEDYMSEVVDLLSIAERRTRRGATQSRVQVGDIQADATELQTALSQIKSAISDIIISKKVNISTHRHFVRAIHGSLQAGKPARRVDYFILNYDTLIEDSLALERITYCDGFSGGPTGWWEPNNFSSSNRNDARVFKVHGSIDWCLLEDDSLPRRIRQGINVEPVNPHVLIYPAATKYQETQRDPFAQIIRHMRQSLRPSEGKELILAICGYSFGDSHINSEIENALYQSEGRLIIMAYVSTDEPKGIVEEWLSDSAINEQVRVYANKGFFHGNVSHNTEDELPWWKFEILTRLLGGER